MIVSMTEFHYEWLSQQSVNANVAVSPLATARQCRSLDAGGHLFLDALVHAVVELLLADEDGEGGEDAEEAGGRLEGPEATLLHPRDHAAAVIMG